MGAQNGYISGTPQFRIQTAMLFPVATSPPIRAIQARHHRATGILEGSLFFIALVIHFLTGGIIMNAKASQYCHVIRGIALYQAKG